MEQEPSGQLVPIYSALTERQLTLGVPRAFAILLWMITFALGFLQFAWFLFPISALVHMAGAYFCRKDAYFFECFQRSRTYRNYYE